MKNVICTGLLVMGVALSSSAWAAGFDLPPVSYPADNAYSPAKAELGKKLFFDPRLSGSNIMSCATCHNPAMGWADGQPVGIGHEMRKLGRNSPTIINSAYNKTQFWDGRAANLEEQAKGPIFSSAEMHEQDEAELMRELKAVPYYVREFERVFPGEGISVDTVAKAIATYEREIVSSDSAFDRFQHGDATAMSESAQRGWDIFKGRGRCLSCHSGPNFTDDRFHDIGVDDGDEGRIAVTGKKRDRFKFKTPTLRDVTRTAPYMHNGQDATLMDVMRFYNRGGDRAGSELSPLGLSETEMADVVAFMQALTGPDIVVTLPQLP
ncbi:MAG: cytochrome-c peroxidase [Leptospirillia bacterium]